jgi:hypothetical protein
VLAVASAAFFDVYNPPVEADGARLKRIVADDASKAADP